MKLFWKIFILGALVGSIHAPVFAETPEGASSATGKVTAWNAKDKTFRFRREKGLELTYRVDELTQLFIDETPKTLDALAPGDSVEIEYVYNKDYEKVVRTIRKSTMLPPKTSS